MQAPHSQRSSTQEARKPPAHLPIAAVTMQLLRAGVTLAAALMALGLLAMLLHGGGTPWALPGATTDGGAATAAAGAAAAGKAAAVGTAVAGGAGVAAILAGAAQLQPIAVIQLGMLVLILTPILRLAAAVTVYFLERDWAFAAISGAILGMVILGMWLGAAG